ncbi:hypothetical protein MNBD_NITROSPINAE01-164 [hydrothermal vent metagenome]|uniref:Uncharacterized protein n=1 Tax=hydrothermal vent metagenome TaxID=652676 RepID=A0A3B1CKW9_9ZZZZ
MSFQNIKVPEKEGETLFVPPFKTYGDLLEENIEKRKNLLTQNKKLVPCAIEARKTTIEKAIAYTKGLGLNSTVPPALNAPIIATGHQPAIFHPGVMIKIVAMNKKAKELNATPLFITVDSDEFRGESFSVPEVSSKKLGKKNVTLLPAPNEQKIFEQVSAPSFEQIERVLKTELEDLSKSESLHMHAKALSCYLKRLSPDIFATAKTLADTLIIMRRVWDEPVAEGKGYLELPVSLLCDTPSFLAFAENIFENIEDFFNVYNGELAKYRKLRKLRYPANPFPDLAVRNDGWLETPFWGITEDTSRTRLFVKRDDNGKIILSTGDGTQTASVTDIASGSLKIRPKAITLTIYLRLFVLDLFIHGVGGAKYDTITDKIIERFYKITPPGYACISATMGLDVPIENPQEKIDVITKNIRLAEQNPEKVAGEDREDIAILAQKKNLLVEKMAHPETDRKTTGLMIKELNNKMKTLMAPEIKRLKETLSSLEESMGEWETARARDYPFFLTDPQKLRSLIP